MLRPIQGAAGLGIPLSPSYTNNSKLMNSVVYTKTHCKASEWDQLNESMHELVQQSNKLVEMSVIGRGSYCFCKLYKHLEVDQLQWMHMTTKQREIHMNKIYTTVPVSALENISTSNDNYSPLTIIPEETNIVNIPPETLNGIWCKASDLRMQGAVVAGPRLTSADPQTIVVASKSSAKHHIVSHNSKGAFTCEMSCLNWAGLRICSHSVAAAHFVSELHEFVRG